MIADKSSAYTVQTVTKAIEILGILSGQQAYGYSGNVRPSMAAAGLRSK